MKILRQILGCLAVFGLGTTVFGQAPGANTVAGLLAQGDASDNLFHTQEALQYYLEADKISPNDSNVLYRMARQYAESMDDVDSEEAKIALAKKALVYAQRAVAADPKNGHAHLALAISYGRLAIHEDNRTEIAYSRLIEESAEEALKLDPTLDYAYYVLGEWNFEMVRLNPLMRLMADVLYGDLPKGSMDKAIQCMQRAVALAPWRAAHHIELGRMYAALGWKEMARAQLKQGMALPDTMKDDINEKRRGEKALQELDGTAQKIPAGAHR